MTVREEHSNTTGTDQADSLTCIQPCIHSAAPTDGADLLVDLEIESFLDALVEVAFAIAARQSRQSESESMK